MKTNGVSGTAPALRIQTIDNSEATELLSKVRKLGVYNRYVPNVLAAAKKLTNEQHMKFMVPTLAGKDQMRVGKALMSKLNIELREAKIEQRIRYVQENNCCVTEPWKW